MFNLEEFKAGVPAVTGNGHKRYYVGINVKTKYNTCKIITVDDNGEILTYAPEGNYDCRHSYNDLVDMYREPKKYWVNVFKDENGKILLDQPCLSPDGEDIKRLNSYIKTIWFEV